MNSGPGQLNQEIPKSFRAEATDGHWASVISHVSNQRVITRADTIKINSN